MKKTGLILLLLAGTVGLYFLGLGGSKERPRGKGETGKAATPAPKFSEGSGAVTEPAVSPAARSATDNAAGGEESENAALRRELARAKEELERISRPLHEDISSSTVTATIQPGESLVTGGYQTGDGNYEVTFLTPTKVKLDDGREEVEIDTSIVLLPEDRLAGAGLAGLATKARNTLQHAEAWSSSDVASTLAAAGATLASPKVRVAPSQNFSIAIGSGETAYTLEGSVDTAADGSFQVKSRIERSEGAQNPFEGRPAPGEPSR